HIVDCQFADLCVQLFAGRNVLGAARLPHRIGKFGDIVTATLAAIRVGVGEEGQRGVEVEPTGEDALPGHDIARGVVPYRPGGVVHHVDVCFDPDFGGLGLADLGDCLIRANANGAELELDAVGDAALG